MTYKPSFPADKLLDRLGPEVARLVLLRRFSYSNAVKYSEGHFTDERLTPYIDIVFAEDPVSTEFVVRPELDEIILHAMEETRSRAPHELARLLIASEVGEEVLEPDELLRWMLRRRLDPLTQATVSGMAAYAAQEIAPTVETLLHTADLGPGTASALLAYAQPARRWQLVAPDRDHPQSTSTTRPLDVFAHLGEFLDRRPRRVRSIIFMRDGLLPQRFDLARPVRARDTLQLEMKPAPVINIIPSLQTPQLTSGGNSRDRTLTSDVQLSQSTIELLELVISDRGHAQVTDRIRIRIADQMVERTASVSISGTKTVDDTAYVHLGTLPRSAGSALRREVTVDGETMTWGGGAVVSLYVQEMTRLLADLAGRAPETPGIPASDWYRVERSVREPWRFISTRRTYAHFGVAEVSWTSQLSSAGLQEARDLWPFSGASMSRVVVEGFRFGNDDGYNVDVECEDTNAIASASIDSVTRPSNMVALERPSRVRVYLTWPARAFRVMVAVSLACAVLLIATGAQGRYGGVSYADINVTLSLASLVTGPAVAYLTAAQFGRSARRIAYLKQIWRGAAVVIITAVLVLATSLSASSSEMRPVFALVDVGLGIYLAVVTLASSATRVVRRSSMRAHMANAASIARGEP
ncbi:hypothetical protein [Lentzea sp. NPDC092896]|uniref:hypothetical protein n=1 Tax=Lentzea sp. NPDC092896 TaxID=3364127 RepID=UPI00381AEE23